ncbi:creatininase family protein [Acetobacter sp. DmW_136]|uniref:creatininase family protein n=1 Tax=Acetobacter sp. DmW_136 TaxID=2591091 RepID=UPI0012392BDD|nr:creatininase family protein [Acetobacter sp. DmW_136]KAA8387797.1 creatininase family protein [Acetobacter sp. DmW_136]
MKKSFFSLAIIGFSALFANGAETRNAVAETACSALPSSVLFEKQTWTEIQSDIACGVTTIIIPVGGTEQSGPYIAVGKHNTRVMDIAQKIAEKSGKTLVAPVVSYVPEGGISPRTSHMKFPGTITIPADVFEKLMASAAKSFQVQGFRLIVFIGDHGGYQKSLDKVATQLNKEWFGTQAQALYVKQYYSVIPHQYAQWLSQHGYAKDVGMHADISDTSLMLAIDPTMVRLDALQKSGTPSSVQGIYGGDPRKASASLGQIGINMQITAAISAINDARNK